MRKIFLAGLATALLVIPSSHASALPAWARKYNMNCSGCHAPAVPRLNVLGYAFKWAGYRMPNEIGEKQEVKNVGDVLAARVVMQYSFSETEKSSPQTSQFQLDNATVWAGGSFGTHYGAFAELAHSADGVELVGHITGVWGNEDNSTGFRVGQMHWLLEGGVAGFDRPTGISFPAPLDGTLTSALPFTFNMHRLGLEGFWVSGKNRFSAAVLNSVSPDGMTDVNTGIKKDFALIDQYIYDHNGSGLTAVAYAGQIVGADSTVPDVTSNYSRFVITANKIFTHAEIMGGYAFGKDNSLPVVPGGAFSAGSVTGNGYWLYGGWTFPNKLTTFSRYDVANPNTDISNSGNNRWMLGTVLPISLPEYLRWAAEYTLDMPRASGSLKKHGFITELQIAF
jgi:hypothetical protein